MEEKRPYITFASLTFMQKLAGLNYLAIKYQQGKPRTAYEFLLGLPVFTVVGIFFLGSRTMEQPYFKIEQFVVCGISFFSVWGLTRLLRYMTPDELKKVIVGMAESQRAEIRKTAIRYSVVYYGFSIAVITAVIILC